MTNSQRLATVRDRIVRWLAEQQPDEATQAAPQPTADPQILRESLLIRDEFYVGRRFHAQSHQAVWFIEEDQLKIYRNDGELVCVFTGEQIDRVADHQDESTKIQPEHDSSTLSVIKLPIASEEDGESGQEFRRAA